MIKVSIITPSLNQARFLPEALRSVSGQDYPQIEHIAIDGGSTDGSVDILSDWKQRDLRLISEPDCGPADAVNKGWRVASGAIIACLHADQLYLPGAVSAVVRHFERNPNCRAVYGRTALLKEDGTPDDEYPTGPWDYNRLLNERICRQPAVFWRSGASSDFGVFDERLRFAFDYEYWLRVGQAIGIEYHHGRVLAALRRHRPDSACWSDVRAHEEILAVVCRYAPSTKPVHHWLKVLARRRAAADLRLRCQESDFDKRLQRLYATWVLIYAEQFEIALDDTILSELDELC